MSLYCKKRGRPLSVALGWKMARAQRRGGYVEGTWGILLPVARYEWV